MKAALVDEGIEQMVQLVDQLEARWQDEQGFEEFSEYVDVARNWCETMHVEFQSLAPYPFAFRCRTHLVDYEVKAGEQMTVTQTKR